jgi:cell division protein FtsN
MDYKNRIPGYRPPRPPRRKSRAGLWASVAVVGVLTAVAIGWAVTRPKSEPQAPVVTETPPTQTPDKDKDKNKTVKNDPKKKPPTPEKDNKPAEATAPVKPVEPRFTFYKILPEQEAIIPESEIKALKNEESQGKKPSVQYMLQAGSFANAADADKLKVRLSALKIKSHVETVKIENATWLRVKVGPFNNMADADRVRVYLRTNQLDSVIQKAVPPANPTH